MFKHLFPTLLVPVLFLGSGCLTTTPQTVVDSTPEPQMNAEVDAFEAGTYTLNAQQSEVTWEASKRVGATHNGTVSAQEGALIVEAGAIVGGSVLVDMNTIVDLDLTDEKFNTMLVTHLKSEDFFAVEQYLTATFAVSEVVKLEGLEGATHRVDGTMTIKGIDQDVSFPATVEQTEAGLQVTGSVVLDRTLWDVRFGSDKFFDNLGDNLIENEFTLGLNLLFTLAQ